MLGNGSSHGGEALGQAHFSSGLKGQEHWRDTPERTERAGFRGLIRALFHISFNQSTEKLDAAKAIRHERIGFTAGDETPAK